MGNNGISMSSMVVIVPRPRSPRAIDPKGKRVVVHVGDIALPATSEAIVKTATDRFGRLDVLFNNAGMFTPRPFLKVDEVEYDRFVDMILKGKFFAAQAAAKAMKQFGRGSAIVQTGSVWGLQAIYPYNSNCADLKAPLLLQGGSS